MYTSGSTGYSSYIIIELHDMNAILSNGIEKVWCGVNVFNVNILGNY